MSDYAMIQIAQALAPGLIALGVGVIGELGHGVYRAKDAEDLPHFLQRRSLGGQSGP